MDVSLQAVNVNGMFGCASGCEAANLPNKHSEKAAGKHVRLYLLGQILQLFKYNLQTHFPLFS